MFLPWEGWFHCMSNTYGTWVRGDARGWRTRHHREHVEGDYKHPPAPGSFEAQLGASQRLMTHPPVLLAVPQRPLACRLVGDALIHYRAEVAELVVAEKHFHGIVRFLNCERPRNHPAHDKQGRDTLPRYILGKAKSWCSSQMKKRGVIDVPEGIWGVRSEIVPVESQAHFDFLVTDYLPRHVTREGGVLYSTLPR